MNEFGASTERDSNQPLWNELLMLMKEISSAVGEGRKSRGDQVNSGWMRVWWTMVCQWFQSQENKRINSIKESPG